MAGLQRELKELGETKARLDRDMAAAGSHEDLTAGRIATHQDLTGLFRRHGLQLIEESRPTAGAAAALPGSLRAALTRVGLKQADKVGELRVYKLAGSFLNVMQAVRELADQPTAPAVPLSLTMAAGDSDDDRHTVDPDGVDVGRGTWSSFLATDGTRICLKAAFGRNSMSIIRRWTQIYADESTFHLRESAKYADEQLC